MVIVFVFIVGFGVVFVHLVVRLRALFCTMFNITFLLVAVLSFPCAFALRVGTAVLGASVFFIICVAKDASDSAPLRIGVFLNIIGARSRDAVNLEC